MGETVYALCAVTSFACAVLLWRGYRRSRSRFLLWCSLCFVALAANNGLLFVDLVLLPNVNLLMARTVLALIGMLALLYGMIWDSD
jgi:hydrogenase/urease accessory protein HupE